MNKYPLGRDILVRWSLDLGGQPFDELSFEYDCAGGKKSVSDFDIENNTLSWTFPGEEQHSYGAYGLHLVAFFEGEKVAEFKLKDAFEIIHGTVSDEPQTIEMESSVETSQESPEPVVEEEESSEYVSRSPLYVEKVPLGSNIIVQWKLLSAEDFDFDLGECELQLKYAAAGSGGQLAEDYELLPNNIIQWNFAAGKQVRFGLYSLFLDVYYNNERIATLVREDAFALVHRKGSELLADRIISFESVVTTLGGGALYSLTDVLNDGYSTVYRADGVTPAGDGDILLFNGEKWVASNDADLASLVTLRDSLAALAARLNLIDDTVAGLITSLDSAILDIASNTTAINANSLAIRNLQTLVAALSSRVSAVESDMSSLGQVVGGQGSDIDGILSDLADAIAAIAQNTEWIKSDEDSIAQLIVDANRILASVEDIYGNIAQLEITSESISTRVSDAEGNISTLQQTASGFDLRVANVEGDVGELYLTAEEFGTRISDAEGNISTLEQTSTSLTSRISDAEGDVSVLQQTASSLTSAITNAEGDISVLQQTATGLESRVQSAEGGISTLQQTSESIQLQVDSQQGDIATLQVSARGITSRVSDAEGNISVLEQTATSLTSRITDAEGDISTISQDVDSIELRVETAEGNISSLTTDVSGIHADVQGVQTDLESYEQITDAAIANMQDQIDGVIETWYYNGVPTLNNLPASQWSAADMANHVGDLYYDKDTGKAYRFMLDNTQSPAVYVWVELADEDIAKALVLAGEKKRVFVATPYAPYDAGDLWVRQKTVGGDTVSEIWRCKTSRAADASPSFVESEWEPADSYGYVVNKSNLEVLSNKIVGQVTEIQYNQDGTITSQCAGLIEANARSVRISTVVDNVAYAGITIDSTNRTGSVTIFSDNFYVKAPQGNKTALSIINLPNGDSVIDVDSLNVNGILSAPRILSSDIRMLDNNSNITAGLSGLYDSTPHSQGGAWGHGIAAWYGGPKYDWKDWLELTPAEQANQDFAKTLFRMDGSGYLAGGEIQWGANGELILHGTSTQNPITVENAVLKYGTTQVSIEQIVQFMSWFSLENYDTNKWRIKLASTVGGTGIDGFYVQGAIWSDGDQIVGSGTPGGGGGGAGYLYELGDVYSVNNYVARADGTEKQPGDVLQYYDSTKGWVAAPISTGQTYYRDFGITLTNNAFSVAHDVAAYADEQTITFDPDSHSGVMAENPVEWGAAITYGVNLMVNNTTKGLALASSVVDLWTAVNGKQPAGNYLTSVPLATDSVIGGFQTGFTQSGKNYPVQLSSNKAYVNVPWTDTTYSNATTSAAGLMSAADKTKLNGIAEGANNYSLPTASSSVLGGIKIGTGLTIDSSGVVSVTGQTQGTVTRVYVGSTAYNPDTSGYVSLPAYPTVPTNVSAFTNDAGYITSYTNTWRNVYTGGTSRVGTGTDTKAINFAAGSNVTITYEAAGTGSGQSGSANYFNVKIAASMAFSNLTSHPTTIAGYGITDAKIANGVITLGSNTITPLTSHQTLYNLVINNSAGTAQITYKPGTSGTYSLTLTKAMVGLSNVENTALSTWAGTTNITTLGTITSGTWSGTTIGVTKGGTGKTSIAAFAIIYASAANTYAELAPNTTSTRKFLRMTGTGSAGAAPAWDTVTKTDVGLGNVPNWAVTSIDSTTQNFVN